MFPVRALLITMMSIALARGAVARAPSHPEAEGAGEGAASNKGDATAPETSPGLSGVHPLSFYVELGQNRNPAIRAARREVSAIEATIPQVTSLSDPVLTETFRPFPNNSLQTASGRAPNSLMISQEVPWPEKLDVRGAVAEQEARIALAQLASEELTVTEAIRRTYYDLFFYQRALEITKQSQQLLEKIKEFAKIRLESGGSLQDVVLVKIEQQRLREKLIDYRARLHQAQARLAALIDAPPGSTPRARPSLDLPPVPEKLERLYALAGRNRPKLHEAAHSIQRQQEKRRLARLGYYPDLKFGVSWGAITTDGAVSNISTGNDIVGFTVGMDLPVYRERIRAGVREAENRLVAAARRYEVAENKTFRQIRRLLLEADAAAKKRDLYRERLIPRAEDAITLSMADYEAAQTDILQVITNYTELLTFRIQAARLSADLGQALASLSRVVGCDLSALEREPVGAAPPPAPAPDDNPVEQGENEAETALHERAAGQSSRSHRPVSFHPEIISLGPD